MAKVAVTIRGTLYPLAKGTEGEMQVVLQGDAVLTDLTVGGGPIYPPDQPPSGGGQPGVPTFPIAGPGPFPPKPGYPPYPSHPGPILPPDIVPIPPDTPSVPPPGSPPLMVEGTQPVNPMVPPQAVVIEYPGIGKVLVPQPTGTISVPPAAPTPTK